MALELIMRKNNKLLIDVKPINLEMGDYLCFSNFEALNKSENFEYIKNFTMEDSAGQVGGFSYCHTLIEKKTKNNIFAIDNDRDGSFPSIHKLLDEDNNLSFFFNSYLWHPKEIIDNILKIPKGKKLNEFSINDNNLFVFALPDSIFKTAFTEKDIGEYSKDPNKFINDRKKKRKLLKFDVSNGIYEIYTIWHVDVFGEDDYTGFDILGHLVQKKKKKKIKK